MQGLSLAIWLALHICFSNPGSARTAYWTEWAILPSSQINKEFLLLSLVFPGIFQRPLHIHYTPFLTAAPHQSLRLLKMPCSQGFLCLSADPGDSDRSRTQSYTSCYKFSLQELSLFLPWDLRKKHSAEQCLQPWSAWPELGCPATQRIFPNLTDTKAYCRAAICQNTQSHAKGHVHGPKPNQSPFAKQQLCKTKLTHKWHLSLPQTEPKTQM